MTRVRMKPHPLMNAKLAPINVRLTIPQMVMLDEESKASGNSRSSLVRTALNEHFRKVGRL